MDWIIHHYKLIVDLVKTVLGWKKSSSHAAPSSTLTAQGAKVTNSPVASGTNISQTINSPTVNLSLPTPLFGAPGRERYEEWRELIDEIHDSSDQMGYAFVPIVAHEVGDERCDYQAGIRRGNRVLRNRILIAEAIQKSGLIQDWDELVRYAHSGRGPRDRWEQGSPTMGGFDVKAQAFQEKLMRVARDDVGTRDGVGPPLEARESEAPRCDFWLEFSPQGSRFLLIQNNGAESAFDAAIYIPTDGSDFKSDVINRLDNDRNWVPCTLKGNFVSLESMRRVLAGTVLHASDSSDEVKNIPVIIRYRTHRQQSCECHLEIRLPLKNGIQFALPEVAEDRAHWIKNEMKAKLAESQLIDTPMKEMNREFVRPHASTKMPSTDEDQSNWPDVILECQWPSLVHESKIPGSHIVRKRPWMLRHGGPGAVYNVCVHKIDFGEYEARFPSPVRTLTDAASVYPIICWKSDGQVIDAHDLESLIHNPPSGCDVQQYAVRTDENEDEEIRLEDFALEVEIPVTISYDDKNGNCFKIKYLLHYDTYMEKGEMIRISKIEKVAPK